MISSQNFEATGAILVFQVQCAMVYFIYLKFFMHGSLSTNIY